MSVINSTRAAQQCPQKLHARIVWVRHYEPMLMQQEVTVRSEMATLFTRPVFSGLLTRAAASSQLPNDAWSQSRAILSQDLQGLAPRGFPPRWTLVGPLAAPARARPRSVGARRAS
jgi:hypothetical protein